MSEITDIPGHWSPATEKPSVIGCMLVIRLKTVFNGHENSTIVIGHALTNGFTYPNSGLIGLDSYEVTHWMMLPLIPGLDRYFRELPL